MPTQRLPFENAAFENAAFATMARMHRLKNMQSTPLNVKGQRSIP